MGWPPEVKFQEEVEEVREYEGGGRRVDHHSMNTNDKRRKRVVVVVVVVWTLGSVPVP